MSISLTGYWHEFVDQMIKSGRYNNQSEVIRAGLRALEEKESSLEAEFSKTFSDGRSGEPGRKVIQKTIARQKEHRRGRQ